MTTGTGSVTSDYRHIVKQVVPGDEISVGGARLKWYHVHRTDQSIPAELDQQARDFLRAEANAGTLAFDNEYGFVIVHLSGEAFYFLLVSTWRGANEVWETVYVNDGRGFEPGGAPQVGPHRATFCVWELAAVLHERDAWTRVLQSARDDAAVEAYFADRYAGPA
jgi:hypothetical protein